MKIAGNLLIALIVLLLVSPHSLQAGTGPTATDYYNDDPLTKLFRGFANVLESPVELACFTREPFYENPWQATGSFFKGIGMGVRRAALGVLDIITFPFPGDSNLHPVCSHSKYYALPI